MKHVRTLYDLSTDDIHAIIERSLDLKRRLSGGERAPMLTGRNLALLFEKPSLRTRVSFEAGMTQLGGGTSFLSTQDAGLHGREALKDVARVLSSFVDVVAMRTFSQQLIADFAANSSCPVVNALSDELHPCQVLTDLLTLTEVFGDVAGRKLVYVGDGNNIARSLAIGSARVGASLTICTPPTFAVDDAFLADIRRRIPTADVTTTTDPATAVKQADVVYTDVWASMGQEAEAAARRQAFAPYQVNAQLLGLAPAGCRFMHDLPAHRGEEVTDDVIDGPASLAFQQAENRMHLAKGLLAWLLDAS
ncbi:MAG: ornithine carbamoyltransferase [Planctomycetaceae bacterium]